MLKNFGANTSCFWTFSWEYTMFLIRSVSDSKKQSTFEFQERWQNVSALRAPRCSSVRLVSKKGLSENVFAVKKRRCALGSFAFHEQCRYGDCKAAQLSSLRVGEFRISRAASIWRLQSCAAFICTLQNWMIFFLYYTLQWITASRTRVVPSEPFLPRDVLALFVSKVAAGSLSYCSCPIRIYTLGWKH